VSFVFWLFSEPQPPFFTCVQVQLKSVFGMTAASGSQLACSPAGLVAYPSGSAVVLYDPKTNSQVAFLTHSAMKPVASLAFSADSKYLAVGEVRSLLTGFLHSSADLAQLKNRCLFWVEWAQSLRGCVGGLHPADRGQAQGSPPWNSVSRILPDPAHFGVCGVQPRRLPLHLELEDRTETHHRQGLPEGLSPLLHVFYCLEWGSLNSVVLFGVCLQITGISFSEDGSYFVTCGKSHLKFWSVEGLKVLKTLFLPFVGGIASSSFFLSFFSPS